MADSGLSALLVATVRAEHSVSEWSGGAVTHVNCRLRTETADVSGTPGC
jgi:hypothetical protein